MTTRKDFRAEIDAEDAKIKLLSASLCTVSTEVMGTERLREMRNHYIQLEDKIEASVAECEAGRSPFTLRTKLLIGIRMETIVEIKIL